MTIEYIDNHIQIAKSYLVQQYKESYHVNSIVKALISPIQTIEDQANNIYQNRWIDKAEGVQLDKLGEIIGESRNYKTDDEYRKALYFRVKMNSGGGAPEDIVTAIRFMYQPDFVDYSEPYPAFFNLFVEGSINLVNINKFVNSIKPAGVDFIITYCENDNYLILNESGVDVFNYLINDIEYRYVNSQDNLYVRGGITLSYRDEQCFSEFIYNRSFRDINNQDDIYLVNTNTELEILTDSQDFTIIGGKNFVEIVEDE